jgi:hypothetical protein
MPQPTEKKENITRVTPDQARAMKDETEAGV